MIRDSNEQFLSLFSHRTIHDNQISCGYLRATKAFFLGYLSLENSKTFYILSFWFTMYV